MNIENEDRELLNTIGKLFFSDEFVGNTFCFNHETNCEITERVTGEKILYNEDEKKADFGIFIKAKTCADQKNKRFSFNEKSKDNFSDSEVLASLNKVIYFANSDYKKFQRYYTYCYLKSRGITHLIHFTSIYNVKSILENGIVPVSLFEEYGISNAKITDSFRSENILDGSCFSVGFPNYKMRYFKEANENMVFAILEINTDAIIDNKCGDLFFFKSNASTNNGRDNRVYAIEDLFSEEYKDEMDKTHKRSELRIPESYTTDPQAEIIVKGVIKPEYINTVFIKDGWTMSELHKMSVKDARVKFNDQIFMCRSDSEFWKKTSNNYSKIRSIFNGYKTNFYPF